MQYEKDLASEHRALFLEVSNHLLACNIRETRKPRITTYGTNKGAICHLRTMPHGIDLGFLKGAMLEDKYSLLHGTGKKLRVLSQNSFNKEILDYYLDQAIQLVE